MAKNLLVINVDLRETRVALIEDGIIAELHLERASTRSTLGNIVVELYTDKMPLTAGNFVKLAKQVEDEFKTLNEEIHIAVMGCEVNGPGEARAADIGVAGGRGIGLIFKNGEVVRKVPEAEIVRAMREEVNKFLAERKAAQPAAAE